MRHQTIRLYLGHDIKGERRISENNIRGFLTTVSRSFPGFTVYDASGYWEGEPEPCTVVEILTDAELALPIVRSLAQSYARLFEQESVMVTSSLQTDGPEFIGPDGVMAKLAVGGCECGTAYGDGLPGFRCSYCVGGI